MSRPQPVGTQTILVFLTATQAETDEEVTEEADLGNGESLDLALTFEVVSSVGPQSVFYSPDDDRLVDIVELA